MPTGRHNGPAKKSRTRSTRTRHAKRGRRGKMRGNYRPRERYPVTTAYEVVLNNATLLIPYGFTYTNLSNPPLVAAGSPSPTGLSGYGDMVNRQRKGCVYAIRSRYTFTNQEAYSIVACVCPCNFLPTSALILDNALFSNRRCVRKMVSGVGSPNRATISITTALSDFGGFNPGRTEDAHVFTLSPFSAAADSMYHAVFTATAGVASVAGVQVLVEHTYIGLVGMEPNTELN